jgi:glutamine synthetase
MEQSKIRGMMSIDELKTLVSSNEVETVLTVFTDLYGRFMGKRYDAEYFLDQVADSGSHGCDYLLTVDMEMNPVQGYDYSSWQSGYGDFHLRPDLSTLRLASWLEKTALVICDVEDDKFHGLVAIAPRTILYEQIKKAADMRYEPNTASEMEYYLFENSYKKAARRNYANLTALGWYIEDYHILQGTREEHFNGLARRHLKNSGIPVENSKGEWGHGQHELNVRFTDIMAMADRHAVYKQCLKEIAEQLQMSVSFMAKFSEEQAGSSCHIHISLWKKGKNVFPGDIKTGPVDGSEIFRWFLGGWIKHAAEMMVFYAPTINSYKRFKSESWAPTKLAWSYDNRTAGFRVVGSGSSLRIECRIPGADCNPYLAFAASLASGLDGIKNKIEPPDIFEGDIYTAKKLPFVPINLAEAIKLFAKSSFAKESFGEDVVNHYVHFFNKEQEAFENAVTDWERKRYFERI